MPPAPPPLPPPLAGCFINLDRSTGRRLAMEQELGRLALDWVHRLAACDGTAQVLPPGCTLSPGEYGCYRSHQDAIAAADPAAFTLVLEDDVELSDDLPLILAPHQLHAFAPHDIVFLECQPNLHPPSFMAVWETLLRQLECFAGAGKTASRRTRGVEFHDAHALYRWGALAYVVTPKGRPVIESLLRRHAQQGPINAVDSVFCLAIGAGELQAKVLVPFLATPRLDSHERTTIAGRGPALRSDAGHVARRLCFAGPLGDVEALARRFPTPPDPAVRMAGALVSEILRAQADVPSGPPGA